MRLRLTAAATLAALAVLPAAASGATARPQVRDPKGDARGGLAHVDIVEAQWSTSGRGASKALVGTMTLAAPPNTERAFAYELHAEVRGCGSVQFEYAPGTAMDAANTVIVPGVTSGMSSWSMWLACGGSGGSPTTQSLLLWREVSFAVKGNVLTWSVPLKALPPQVQVGASFSDFEAIADLGDPVFGISWVGQGGQSLDYALGDGVWRLR